MRVYKTQATRDDGAVRTAWSTNKDDAGSDRQEMRSAGYKNKQIRTHTIEFPQTKAGIIKMLNDYAA